MSSRNGTAKAPRGRITLQASNSTKASDTYEETLLVARIARPPTRCSPGYRASFHARTCEWPCKCRSMNQKRKCKVVRKNLPDVADRNEREQRHNDIIEKKK